ncbi:pyrokinin-1 receptor-like [Euwallacea similis]|uniref:pyrokinin-1 receptor-like n=1 Tax=Euwallacea similis TaxID=1736056 RepID=UPI00344BAFCB
MDNLHVAKLPSMNIYQAMTTTIATALMEPQNETTVTNYTTDENLDTLYPIELVIPFTIVYAVIFLTGVIGNISTCVVIAKNKIMHTATNYYLFSLAVSDMLLLISGLPPEMYRIWSPDTYIFGRVICFLQGFSAETSANATVLTITAFTVERYLAICHPFFSHTMSKLSRCVRIIIIIWMVAFTLAVPQAIQFGIQELDDNGKLFTHCTVVTKIFDHAFEISTIVFFVAPMTLITVLYILIGRQLKKSTAKRPSLTQHNSNCTALRYSTHYNNTEVVKKRIRNTQSQNRVVKMLIAVVAAFFVCWAPFHAQRLLAVYLSDASQEAQATYFQMYLYLMYTSGVLYYLSTCINPLLYHIMSNKYRNAFKKTFHNFCSRGSRRRHYIAAPVRNTTKKYPENFLGEALHLVQTGDARTSSNSHWTKPVTTRLTPQTSQTSFSSSKLETSQSHLEKETYDRLMPVPAEEGHSCASIKTRFLKLFKSGLSQSYNMSQSKLNKGSNTISNSSLKDTDEMDFVCADLVRQMKQVNDVL